MRWILAVVAALFAGTVWLLWAVAENSACVVWHPGQPWTLGVVAAVAANGIIATCYFGIPAHVAYYAARLWREHLPDWMVGLLVVFACFILWCGMTHLDLVLARPVVYCTPSLLIKLQTAAFSLAALAGCVICTEPLMLLVTIIARSKIFEPILTFRSPWKATMVLREILKGMGEAPAK
jgi:hypothetical protein